MMVIIMKVVKDDMVVVMAVEVVVEAVKAGPVRGTKIKHQR